MTITGVFGISSEESFGFHGGAPVQDLIQGQAGIASEEAFSAPSGVRVDPLTVPFSQYYSY